ncbi:ST3 beta-galactoside alpha-2,3-sialyltransferase 8 [Electrophorus electricus]|uniref:CMP-N-acetylneuraminate-beta-galactosamide-alpha-2,3-sialyltransferase 2 n=1 Tax=Electrophorus electricus TaxID=8005 RepID=A0A4W4E0B7_ELEEL|nr:ST3 beta-galactoside alpha-2,3-sialyltransferase 8 [Electrophorus electricus]XP_035376035.1 ST3 beta-galactoside alpha-2,3-sialyltransferase 8 [Electrophorus electricus]
MVLKKKLCLGALFCGILFFMIAMYTMPKSGVLSGTPPPAHGVSRPPGQNQTQPRATPEAVCCNSCGCRTCVADAGVSEWFDERYERDQQPCLTVTDKKIDPASLKWWLNLQQSTEGTIEEVIKKMFQVVSSPKETHQFGRYQTCAVVGNSGNLLQFMDGALIDSHSVIFRMNRARTRGYEQHVGKRTTHHFMYPESAMDLAPSVQLVLLPFKLQDLTWLTSALSTGEVKRTYTKVKEHVKADKDKVMVVNPSFFKYTHDRWTEHHGRYPSTGMLAIVFALHLCDEVSVFGFGADAQGNWHHYWENNKYSGAFRKTGVHNADFESEVIKRLYAEGKIKLYPRPKQQAPVSQETSGHTG